MKRSYRLFVEDILTSVDKIENYISDLYYDDFIENHMVVDAVLRNLEIIGEAANNIPDEIRNKFSNIPWKKMIGLRNLVAHGYFGIDMTIIWEIITKNIPETKPDLIEMKNNMN
ncbi:MAG: DUF86 domain-containing protein [Candidatus Thermoplasmatota archaeon]|nr:DUF86 domain-containing protein [Candidatus Thermoplasmatota archaeon]